MDYKKQRFMEILEEEIRYVRLLKMVKEERERLIKEDIVRYGSTNKLLQIWKNSEV